MGLVCQKTLPTDIYSLARVFTFRKKRICSYHMRISRVCAYVYSTPMNLGMRMCNNMIFGPDVIPQLPDLLVSLHCCAVLCAMPA